MSSEFIWHIGVVRDLYNLFFVLAIKTLHSYIANLIVLTQILFMG